MARANLNVSAELTEAFTSAQDSNSSVRAIKVKIQSENLIVSTICNKVGSCKDDFDSILLDLLEDTNASLIIYNLSDNVETSSNWLLLSWIPDECKVRDKMLYSSSREDLKRALGFGFFKSEYASNLKTDVTWSLFQDYISKGSDKTAVYLSEKEKLILSESVATDEARNENNKHGMGSIPFQIMEDVLKSFQDFYNNSINWIELELVNESVHLITTRTIESNEKLQQYLCPVNARFILTKLTKKNGEINSFFIFSCPENTKPRIKMTMSTAKASIIGVASSQGIKFDKTPDIHGIEEIDELIIDFDQSNLDNAASSAAIINHAKPQRPGKGSRAKTVFKFKSDDECV